MSGFYNEPAKQVKVYADVDVLVAGGGPAGFGAAYAAAKAGAKTILVEQMGCIGGIATAGVHPQMCSLVYSDTGVNTVHQELIKRVEGEGIGQVGYRYGECNMQFEIEGLKVLYEDMLAEVGCEILYHTMVSEPILEGGVVKGAIIESKSGRQAILAKRVVDCTADADVAARAGVGFDQGRPEDHLVQPCTLMFRVEGVDQPKLLEWWEAGVGFDREEASVGLDEYTVNHSHTDFDTADGRINSVWRRAVANGDMEPFQTNLMGFWLVPSRPTQIAVNFTHITHVDPTKAEDLTTVMITGRKQAEQTVRVMKKYVPGCENIYMADTAMLPGTRESRRIHGEYTLTVDEVLGAVKSEDGIAQGNFFVDIHNPAGPGMYNAASDKIYTRRKLPPGEYYDIPYGCIVPKGVENLLVGGRSISVDHEALGSTRQMWQCMMTGEAAGIASVMSIKDNVTPRNIDVQKLRKMMRKNN